MYNKTSAQLRANDGLEEIAIINNEEAKRGPGWETAAALGEDGTEKMPAEGLMKNKQKKN